MKNILFMLLCVVNANAQNIASNGTHFIDGMTDKKWSNSNGKDFTNASFSDFSGSCYVILEIDKTAEVSFQSISTLKKGELELKLTDDNEFNYFYCKTEKNCVVVKDVTLEKGKKYRLYFRGKNAKGNYEVTWKVKN